MIAELVESAMGRTAMERVSDLIKPKPAGITICSVSIPGGPDEVNGILADNRLTGPQMATVEGLVLLHPEWMESGTLGEHWGCRVWGLPEWVGMLSVLLNEHGTLPRPRGTRFNIAP